MGQRKPKKANEKPISKIFEKKIGQGSCSIGYSIGYPILEKCLLGMIFGFVFGVDTDAYPFVKPVIRNI